MPSFARPSLSLCLLAFAAIGLQGCVAAVVGGAAAGAYATTQDRGLGGAIGDGRTKAEIQAAWLADDADIESYVDLNVFDRRVLLTGTVPNPTLHDHAVADAWKASNVAEVIDEIRVGQHTSFGTDMTDNWIQTRLRTELTVDPDVNSLNYTIETVDGVVYILGIASSQAELDKVVDHARNMANVRRVVNYAKIEGGSSAVAAASPPAERPAPPPAEPQDYFSPEPDSSTPAPAPIRGTIQAEPLQ